MAWYVGKTICNGCKAALDVTSALVRINCYLCGAQLDLSHLPLVDNINIEEDEAPTDEQE